MILNQADAISDLTGIFTGGFDFQGIVGTITLLFTIAIVGGLFFIFVYTIYKMTRYKIVAVVMAKQGEDYTFLRLDSIGLFKDTDGVFYSKFRKTRERIENLDYKGILRGGGRKQVVLMVKEGENSYYQVIVPRKFYSVDGKVALPVIDHNVLRTAMSVLTAHQKKYRLQESTFQKYGTHIAILIVVLVMVVGGYILLRKEEQLLALVGQLIQTTANLQESVVGQAIAGG